MARSEFSGRRRRAVIRQAHGPTGQLVQRAGPSATAVEKAQNEYKIYTNGCMTVQRTYAPVVGVPPRYWAHVGSIPLLGQFCKIVLVTGSPTLGGHGFDSVRTLGDLTVPDGASEVSRTFYIPIMPVSGLIII